MTGTSKAKLIVGIVIGVLGIIIVLQNFQRVDTMLLLWRLTMPHIVLLAIVFVAGFILGTVISMLGYFGSPKERKTE